MTDTASSTQVATAAEAFGDLHADALVQARKNKLIDESGTIWCWNCGQKPALLPGLHCPFCRAEHIAGKLHAERQIEHPETRRWRALNEHMSNGELSREHGETLMRNCEGLPSATPERRAELARRFDVRFGAREQSAPSWAGRGFRRSGTDDER